MQIGLDEVRENFEKILDELRIGEEIIVSESGKPVARIIPFEEPGKSRIPGLDKGLFQVPEDFDTPLPDDIMDAFES